MKKKKTSKRSYISSNTFIISMYICITLLITVQIFCKNMFFVLDEISQYTEITFTSETKLAEDEEEIKTLYDTINDNTLSFYIDYSEYFINEFGLNKNNLANLSSHIPLEVNYITKSRSMVNTYKIMNTDESAFNLLESGELGVLLSKGSLVKRFPNSSLYHFVSHKCTPGYLVFAYSVDSLDDIGFNFNQINSSNEYEIVFRTNSDGTILFSSLQEYIGSSIDSVLTATSFGKSIAELKDYGLVYCSKSGLQNGNILYSFIPLSTLFKRILRSAIVPIILFWVVITTLLIYVLKIKKTLNQNLQNENLFRLTSKLSISKAYVSHISSLGLFGIIIIAISIFYIRSLISFCDQSIKASDTLQSISETYDINQNNKSILNNDVDGIYFNAANVIAWGYSYGNITVNNNTLYELYNCVPWIASLTFIDSDGDITASTNTDFAHSIGNNSESPYNQKCWEILNGETANTVFKADKDSTGDYYNYYFIRRQDDKGAVILGINVNEVTDFLNKMDLEETIVSANMGNATGIAYLDSDPDTIYMTEAGKTTATLLDISLNEHFTQGGYSGIQRLKGVRYYVNTYHNTENGAQLISALPLKYIPYKIAWDSLASIIFGMIVFIISLCLFAGTVCTDNVPEENLKPLSHSIGFSNRNNLINEAFKKVIGYMVIANTALLALLVVIDYLVEDSSLVVFLFGSDWNKGLNLFSITMILFILVGCNLFGFFLTKLVLMICNNMGPRGMTIGHLIGSLIRFIILIVTILWSLKEIGCNLTALLTGAGIAGAAISLCANSTVSDLLCGFFIVFEGAFQIGDWIKVGDWRGQVLEIGMRTTKVAYADCIKIMNNSSMTNVTVMDISNSGALVKIDVGYNEDVSRVIELINANTEFYLQNIPEIEDGPYVKGVTDMGASSITIEMYAFGEQEYIARIERGLRLYTKQLFDENNIEIPFNQVTIHHAD